MSKLLVSSKRKVFPKIAVFHPSLYGSRYFEEYKEFLQSKGYEILFGKDSIKYYHFPDEILFGKNIIYFSSKKGNFIKRCPGTKDHICCGYLIIDVAKGCNFDCSYCYLQAYLEDPFITVYTNVANIFLELDEFFSKKIDFFPRFGTGEFTDSLSVEPLHLLNRELVKYFSKRKGTLLELKTKSDNVSHLLDLDPKDSVVVSWSLNPQTIIDREEIGAASLEKRILAARKCQDRGYLLGFHFDPIIYFEGFLDEYRKVLELLAKNVLPDRIVWISLGTLRFPKELRPFIERRFPESDILYSCELIKGRDGKYRYFKDIRVDIYKNMFNLIKEILSDSIFCYLCMETEEVWERSFGKNPNDFGGLRSMFDARLKKFFNKPKIWLK